MVFDQGGTRERMAADKWQDGQVVLRLILSEIRDGYSVQIVGSLATDGAIYGTSKMTYEKRTANGPMTPTVSTSAVKIMPFPPTDRTAESCNLAAPPTQPLKLKAVLDNFYLARRTGDLSTASCWIRTAANGGLSAAYDQLAFELLVGVLDECESFRGRRFSDGNLFEVDRCTSAVRNAR